MTTAANDSIQVRVRPCQRRARAGHGALHALRAAHCCAFPAASHGPNHPYLRRWAAIVAVTSTIG